MSRRSFLTVLAALPFLPAVAWASTKSDTSQALQRLAQIETRAQLRLGLYAYDTGDARSLSHRGQERFAFCSAFKAILAGAILKRSEQDPGLLQRRISYSQRDLVNYSPITEKHVEQGMLVGELCAAAVQYSDNGAANLLLRLLDGPAGLTAFARSLGDREFRLDRWETELNSAVPGDPRDTTTPQAMAETLRTLALGNVLTQQGAAQLNAWLLGNTTGAGRIRAGVPEQWKVGDRTGSGQYGVANDVAVLWPPQRAPLVLVIFISRQEKDLKPRPEYIAEAARIVVDWFG